MNSCVNRPQTRHAAQPCPTGSRPCRVSVRAEVARPSSPPAAVETAPVKLEQAPVPEKISPLLDRVLLKPVEEERAVPGGILLPKGPPKSSGDAHFGTVIAVGDKVSMPLAKGDTVVYQKVNAAEVTVPDEGQVVFVSQRNVIGKLE